jgi:hypothetical protein
VEDSQASSHTGLAGKELRQLYLALAENKWSNRLTCDKALLAVEAIA